MIIFLILIILYISTFITFKNLYENNSKPVEVKIKEARSDKTINFPERGSINAAAFDLHASWIESKDDKKENYRYFIQPGETVKIHTNIIMEIPDGYYLDICSRSGLSINEGIVVVNSPARIDSDYRGEIIVGLKNTSNEEFEVLANDRVAQCTLHKLINTEFKAYPGDYKFSETRRGKGGLGHSGISKDIRE